MSPTRLLRLTLLGLSVAAGAWSTTGCDASASPAEATTPPTTTSSPAAEAPAAAVTTRAAAPSATYADEDLPVQADFEADAEKRIDDASYTRELDRIEQALTAPSG